MRSIIAIAVLSITGCDSAADMHWNKPNGSQAEFAKDDYSCRKDALAGGSVTAVPIGGFVALGRNADMNLYRQCMRAQGYTLE